MNVLVTGGAGYIGSVTTELLLESGHDVVVFDNLERGHRGAVDRRARFIEGDLRSAHDIEHAVADARPDAVMHFAAYAYVGESMEQPLIYFQNNLGGGIHLATAMAEHGVRPIIFSSTCAIYGQPERVPITEDETQAPANPYGESKLMLERILGWCWDRKGLRPVFLRYFNAAGCTEKFGEDHDPEPHIIPRVLQVAAGKMEKFMIFGDDYDTPDGTCIRDYIHIADLARAHILALEGNHEGAFNLGNGEGYSVKQVLEVARRVTGKPIPAEVAPRRPGDPARLVADAEKARRVLGWEPQYPELESILRSAWNWHLAHPQGYRT